MVVCGSCSTSSGWSSAASSGPGVRAGRHRLLHPDRDDPVRRRRVPDGELPLWPFGRTTVPKPSAGALTLVGNVIWFIVAGWWLALGHIVSAILQFITIIGIPLAIANIKLVPVSLFPLGHEIVDADDIRVERVRRDDR